MIAFDLYLSINDKVLIEQQRIDDIRSINTLNKSFIYFQSIHAMN